MKITAPTADTPELETEIDEMVYQLYELTEDEKKFVNLNFFQNN